MSNPSTTPATGCVSPIHGTDHVDPPFTITFLCSNKRNVCLNQTNQTDVRLDPNQSQNGKYNLVWNCFNEISLCVCTLACDVLLYILFLVSQQNALFFIILSVNKYTNYAAR